MKIIELSLINYRNFNEEIKFKFNEEINFIIGENNLGKSNLLKLFDKIFNSRSLVMFGEEDFFDIDKKIKLKLKLKLDKDCELGIFEDNFSPESKDDSIFVNLEINQALDDEVEIRCPDTNTMIKRFDLKKFNLFYINSIENQNNHLGFIKKYGVDGSLSKLLEKCMTPDEKSRLISELGEIKDFDNLKELLEKINKHFSKLYISDKHQVCVDFNDLDNVVCNLFSLKEPNGIDLKMSGQGLKSLLYLELAILHKLFKIQKESSMSLSSFDLIISIDEPEVHLHSYKQRCFIKYLLGTFKFEEESIDNKFKELLFDLFRITSLDRQIFVATHSADILLEDYKQIVRFYKEGNSLKVVSGKDIEISEDKELKHYLQHIREFKEAFFCKGLVICEGDTEIGFLKSFFNKKDVDLDDLGISILPAGSCDSIPIIKELCNRFGIPAIGIRDRDSLSQAEINALKEDEIYCTNKENSEEEFMDVLDVVFFSQKARENSIFIRQVEQIDGGIITEIPIDLISTELKSRKNKNRVFKFKCAECLNSIPPFFEDMIDKIVMKVGNNESNSE